MDPDTFTASFIHLTRAWVNWRRSLKGDDLDRRIQAAGGERPRVRGRHARATIAYWRGKLAATTSRNMMGGAHGYAPGGEAPAQASVKAG
jgi:hypothetical protein